MKPAFEGKTVSVWRHRAFATSERLRKATDPDKIAALQATADRYAAIIADLEAREAADRALLPKLLQPRPGRTHRVHTRSRASSPLKPSSDLGVTTPFGIARRTTEGLWLGTPTLPHGLDWEGLLVPSKLGTGWLYVGPEDCAD